jgi:outer membrane protein OmpA-like peptidoglycan-associated protein
MPTDGAAQRPSSDDQPLAELRAILLGPDRAAWEALQQRLDNPSRRAEDVAGVLPEAVRLRSDVKLRRALQPLLEDALQLSVQHNPRMLANALFPIFGKAIRRAITAELEGMLQSLTQTLEQRFSLRSLRWRWEAYRTGKPYVEVVMLRSLLFRVEQVFLIHRESGLLLQNVAIPSVRAKDPEMVSAMLTAIQDFVRDSVSSAEHEDLDTIRMGEIAVLVAYGPRAILAAFVRGVPPRNLNSILQNALHSIEQRKSEALRTFSGDVSAFEGSRVRLQACLLGQGIGDKPAATSWGARALLFGIPVLIVLALAGWWIYSSVVQRRFTDYAHRLESEPGIVLTHVEKRGSRFYVAGLRDPLAANPVTLLPSNLPAAQVEFQWEQYHSLAPRFAEQRRLGELKDELEKRAFRFPTGSADVPPEQHFLLEDTASQILSILQAAAALGKTAQIEIVGNHDPIGTEGFNSHLARTRAENVRSALISLGVPGARVAAVPEDINKETCAAVNDQQRLLCRSASFRVRGIP